MPRQLFISDLHLEASRPDISAAMFEFLDRFKGETEQLFILGDLFEAWIGDDYVTELSTTVASALASFEAAGSGIYLMHGNRDFLLGEGFASSCSATLIHEPCVIETQIGKLLLMHGDSLCTDDMDYQKFRAVVRNPAWQQEFLSQSLEQRQAFAKQARTESSQATAGKKAEIMDVNTSAVSQALREANSKILLHGHTHRPAIHSLGNPESQRVVLGDWDKQGWYGEINDNGLALHSFEFGSLK